MQGLTFLFRDRPLGAHGGLGGAHVILGIHLELVLPVRHDVAMRVLVVEDAVCHGSPTGLGGVTLGHFVVQPVVQFLIRRGCPRHSHSAGHVLIQLHRARGLWLV